MPTNGVGFTVKFTKAVSLQVNPFTAISLYKPEVLILLTVDMAMPPIDQLLVKPVVL